MLNRWKSSRQAARLVSPLTLLPLLLALVGGILVITGGAQADHSPGHEGKKGGGNNGGGGSAPPGRIYFSVHGNGCWSMVTDGTDVRVERCEEPSQLLHGDGSGAFFGWFLRLRDVEGDYPDGSQRREVFAVREDGAREVQLTDDPNVKPWNFSQLNQTLRWAKDDSTVSFAAVKWHSDDVDDTSSHIFVVPIEFDAEGVPAATGGSISIISEPVACFHPAYGGAVPVYRGHDVSPQFDDGSVWLVYELDVDCSLSISNPDVLEIVEMNTNGPPGILVSGTRPADPEWSPNGARIAFETWLEDDGIWTIAPDGSNPVQVLKCRGTKCYYSPTWSPDSQHLAVVLSTQSNQGGQTTFRSDIGRVRADGKDLQVLIDNVDGVRPIGWR